MSLHTGLYNLKITNTIGSIQFPTLFYLEMSAWFKEKRATDKCASWNDDHTAIIGDPAHLNARGDFLQACVWFGTLTGKPVADVTYQPEGVSAEDTAFLKATAQAVLDTYRQPACR